ncbi:MAG: glutamine--fructose-6-phosphate transaminase (isomerizing), partial [Candidatus Dojkabacteria bacterium]
SNDENKANMINCTAEVKARGAKVIAIGKENNELFDEFIYAPDGKLADAISNVIPFQLLSYFFAIELGNKPDRPRNLAKSVTVK